jgi:hypothetical protein
MRKLIAIVLFAILSVGLFAATKDTGTTTLKDVQPAGTTDKKHKNQQFDMSFVSGSGKTYTCRTNEKDKVNATDIAVGSNVSYEVNGDKGKIKNFAGREFKCTVVRVADAPASPSSPAK